MYLILRTTPPESPSPAVLTHVPPPLSPGHQLSEARQLPGAIRLEGAIQPQSGAPHHAAVRLGLPLRLGRRQSETRQGTGLHAAGR